MIMLRNLKTLGLALVAVLAMSAVVASAASAANFTAASYPVTYSGSQAATEPHVFIADGYETTCKNAEFSGSASAASSTATLTPTYSECTAFGLSATVDMNGCSYTFHLASTSKADADLNCPAGAEVEIVAGGGSCVAHIPPFAKPLGSVAISNVHPNIRGEANVTGISASLTDENFFCPFQGNTTVKNATYTGNLTISGSSTINVD
jgi:hypothetical protein